MSLRKTPPCTEAIIENKIVKVYVGSNDPNPLVDGGGIAVLRAHGIEVETGILKQECDALNEIFSIISARNAHLY